MQQTIWYNQMQIYHSCTRESKKTAHEKLKHTEEGQRTELIDGAFTRKNPVQPLKARLFHHKINSPWQGLLDTRV